MFVEKQKEKSVFAIQFDKYTISIGIMDINVLIAKVLGYLILCGSVLLKAPQIYNILQSQTVDGLSATSLYLELPTTITTMVYNIQKNNPFSSYGETALIAGQNIIIVGLLW
jgi:mannose-P-dolichol utilization defect protein 1